MGLRLSVEEWFMLASHPQQCHHTGQAATHAFTILWKKGFGEYAEDRKGGSEVR